MITLFASKIVEIAYYVTFIPYQANKMNIESKFVYGNSKLAKRLLQEIKKLEAGTLVIDRRGMEIAEDFSWGSNNRRVLN
jgi:hypothetical protein